MKQRLGSRPGALEQMRDARTPLDLLVVGGGISGAGVLLEATLRGYRAGLVERADFASGTSRYSTKLIHGGLRYLLQGATEFVRESVQERAFLLEHGDSLVEPLPFLIPRQSTSDPPEMIERILAAYDALAPPSRLPPHRWVTTQELAHAAPVLRAIDGAAEYYETRTDDARLVLAVLAAAIERGALAVNYVELQGLESAGGQVRSTLRDAATGAIFELGTSLLVIAAGAWLGSIGDSLGFELPELRPGKGTHVVLESPPTGPLTTGLVIRHPDDGRLLTISPWHGHVLLGSTDVECDPSELRRVQPTADEVEYLLGAVYAHAPDWTPRVTAAWSGVRPLLGQHGARTADLSREDHLVDVAPGVTAIIGGKLTTFRRLAMRAVDHAIERAGLVLRGAAPFPPLSDPLHTHTGVTDAVPFNTPALRWVAGAEMVVTLDDVLTRRLGISLLRPDEAAANAPRWAAEIAPILGWSAEECDRQVAEYRSELDRFRDPRWVTG